MEELEKRLNAARAEADEQLPKVALTLFLNGVRTPLKEGLVADPSPGPQPLWVPLRSPSDSADTSAGFWRELVAGVNLDSGDTTTPWGRISVPVGLSRTADIMGSTPDTDFWTKAPMSFTLHVYSLSTVLLGAAALGLFSLGMVLYAISTTILRDNALTLRELPGMVMTARARRDQAMLDHDAAKLAWNASPASRQDPELAKKAAETRIAFDATLTEFDTLERAMNAIPDHRQKYAALAAARSELDKKYEVRDKTPLDDRLKAVSDAAGNLSATVTAEAEAARTVADGLNTKASAADATDSDREASAAAETQAAALAGLMASLSDLRAQAEAYVAAGTAFLADSGMLTVWDSARRALETVIDDAETAIATLTGPTQIQTAIDDLYGTIAAAQHVKEKWEAVKKAEKGLLDVQKQPVPEGLASLPIGPFSLGMTQMAFWFVIVAAAYIFISMTVLQFQGMLNLSVVTLLGISGLTTTGAALVAVDSSARLSRGFWRDIVSANEQPQLQRLQAVAWTVILAGGFVYAVMTSFTMPDYDTNMLLLMGVANGIYVGLKLKEGEKGAPVP